MPTGEHLTHCFECGKSFICGDCIVFKCKECECKQYGHLRMAFGRHDLCARCGMRLDKLNPASGEVKTDG